MIEDAGPVLGVLRLALERAGFAVEGAQTAAAGLERLATRRYAVIVADCFLPDAPPLDWLAAARAAAPDTPLIIYSGSIRLEELRRHGAGVGAVAVLEKPFSPARLVEAVRAALPPER
jgi:two-component system copper resistance phosphate regulon response regulator CusR